MPYGKGASVVELVACDAAIELMHVKASCKFDIMHLELVYRPRGSTWEGGNTSSALQGFSKLMHYRKVKGTFKLVRSNFVGCLLELPFEEHRVDVDSVDPLLS